MRKGVLKTIYNEIKKYNTIYIARHIGPDPDAVASQVALRDSILATFPNKQVYAIGSSVARFKYIGKLDKITSFDYENSLVITLDVPDALRIDGIDTKKFKHIIKIDHHPFVEKYGYIEYVDDLATSACQIVYELISVTRLKCTKNIAENIFVGIMSDTNRLLFDYTSHKSFTLVGDLVRNYKIDIQDMYRKIYLKPLSEFRLMGYIASNIKVTKNKFAFIELENDIIESFNADASSASNMINDLNNINEIIVWMFITKDEKNNIYKVNIRSRGPVINTIASKYNGGGHKFASGARTKERKDLDNLVADLDDACKQYLKELEE